MAIRAAAQGHYNILEIIVILSHPVQLVCRFCHSKLITDPVCKIFVKNFLLHHIDVISNVIADFLDGIYFCLRHRETVWLLRNGTAA